MCRWLHTPVYSWKFLKWPWEQITHTEPLICAESYSRHLLIVLNDFYNSAMRYITILKMRNQAFIARKWPSWGLNQADWAHWAADPLLFLRHSCSAGKGTLSRAWNWLLSNTRKWIVPGDTRADRARDFIGKGRPGGEQKGEGTQENCSAAWLPVSGFMVMGLVSVWSLANQSNPESFLMVHTSLSQGGC